MCSLPPHCVSDAEAQNVDRLANGDGHLPTLACSENERILCMTQSCSAAKHTAILAATAVKDVHSSSQGLALNFSTPLT